MKGGSWGSFTGARVREMKRAVIATVPVAMRVQGISERAIMLCSEFFLLQGIKERRPKRIVKEVDGRIWQVS